MNNNAITVVFVVAAAMLVFVVAAAMLAAGLLKAKRDAIRKKEQAIEFRKIYGLPDDAAIYQSSGVTSMSPMNPTNHEKNLAKYVIDYGFFNRNYIFLDYYFKDSKGKTRQIDLLAVGKRGIFVFESKDYSGWIFGNGGQMKWTQTLNGRKYHFYNPVKQNAAHIRALKDLLRTDAEFHSMIVFSSKATLKEIDYIPHNTYVVSGYRLGDALKNIAKSQPECISEEDLVKICKKINKARIIYNNDLGEKHIEDIDDLTGKSRIYS